MRQTYSIFSSLSFVLTTLAFLIVGFIAWRQGSRTFSPGALSAITNPGGSQSEVSSHADFGDQCRRCHQPLKSRQADLCLECHREIQAELDATNSLHARFDNAGECFACHPDHRGRDFSPTAAALARFDHSITSFSLIRHQVNYDATPMACAACHDQEEFRASNNQCTGCHGRRDESFMFQHALDFGQDCLACHDGFDSMTDFDHVATEFPLVGGHIQTVCSACHLDGNLAETPQECESCHAEPSIHAGQFTSGCEICHTSEDWTQVQLDGEPFNHALNTKFSLNHHTVDYAGLALTCAECHPNGLDGFELQTCDGCHARQDPAFMRQHREEFNPACLECHDGVDRMENFDHASVLPLEGRHAEIACRDCHLDQQFAGIPKECVACHAEPTIHAGEFGLNCQYCHNASAWSPARLMVHTFPLHHGGGEELDCQLCHTSNYVEYTCYGCHDHQPEPILQSHTREGISSRDLPDCAACHPNGLIDRQDS